VLVVDDNATNRLVLKSQLTAWGMRPDTVEDPRAVLTLLREAAEAGRPYAITVLDMCMPEMNGLELARLISADETCKSTKLIMLTSSSQVDSAELKEAGVDQWLTKPVRSSEFYDRLMRLLASTSAAASSLQPDRARSPRTAASLGRVLVVEDNAVNQLVAEGVVSGLGYQVDLVADGAEALDAVSTTCYSAVLMDCHMPVMAGFEATEEIRRRQVNGTRIPIIAMTAGAMAPAQGHGEPAEPNHHSSVIDVQRQSVLRSIGPDDGWGLLPATVSAFLEGSPASLAAMRQAVATGDLHSLRESAHQLKGAAANIGAPNVAAICHQLEQASSGPTPADGALIDQLETELDRATRLLLETVPVAR